MAMISGTYNSYTENINGTSGDDTIDGYGIEYSWGFDIIDGGSGTDTVLFFDSKNNFTISTLAGITRIQGGNKHKGESVLTNVEKIQFNDGVVNLDTVQPNPIISGTYNSYTENINGTSGDDTLDGYGIEYSWGFDIIDGGSGTDTVLFFDSKNNFTISTLAGITRIQGGNKHKGESILTNVEKIQFTDGVVTLGTSQPTFEETPVYTPSIATQHSPTGNVYINGVVQQGLTVSVNHNLDDADGLGAISYQWKINNAVVGTGDSFTLSQNEVGKALTVSANYTDKLGNLESVTSANATVANVNDLPTGEVKLSGTATQGQLLNVSNNLADADGLGAIKYEWLANGVAINGAINSSYLLTANEVGKFINVKASYTDLQGTPEVVLSDATNTVSALTNYPPVGDVIIKGTAKINQMLSVSNNLSDANGFAAGLAGIVTYQWLANGLSISGATSNLYVTTTADAGKNISVQASYTDGLGKLETKNSANLKIENAGSTLVENPVEKLPVELPPEQITEPEKPVILDIFSTLKMPKMTAIKINGHTISKDSTNNKILGEGKNDKLSGLAGNDTLLGNAGDDVLDGGKGNDSIDAGNGNDQLLGGDGNDKLAAGSGNDWLDGGKGNDKLNGDLGSDMLIGGEGVDTMEGGDGDDYYVVENVKDVVTETNNNVKVGGNDIVETKLKTYTLGKNVENLLLTELSDSTGTGNELNNQIVGNIGDNKLNGMDGNDQLFGGKGADTLDGGKGMDTLVGGDDDDVYMVQNGEDVIVETENGGEQDQIFSSVDYSLDESRYIEVLTLSGANAISGVGNDANNLIQEKEGGNTANDFSGGAGNDLLNGEGGNDTLNGGTGDDTLNGGAGTDTAIFNSVKDEYAITRNHDVEGVPQVIIEYVGYGENEGHDELNGIEIIQFSDGDTLNVQDLDISNSSAAMILLTGVAA